MSFLVAFTILIDLGFVLFLVQRVRRGRDEGLSLRVRIFGALAIATLSGALVTGLYVVADEALSTGVKPVATRIAPKAFLVGSVLMMLSAAGAALVGRSLARSIEEITEAATKIAEGALTTRLPRGSGREARHLARALASMRRELEGRPYAAAFLRDAWHDLKTPAAAVKATVEVLEDGALEDPEAARRFLKNLRGSADQLERTLMDLVTLSRFETATLGPEEFLDIHHIAQESIELVRPLAEAHQIRLHLAPTGGGSKSSSKHGPRMMRGDAGALVRAIGNLLENAVDATQTQGEVCLEVDTQDDEAIHLEISNQPSEVPEEIRDRLFERSTTSRQGKGSGLGLAIARAAVEAHNGRIRFISFGPPRVCVHVELPR